MRGIKNFRSLTSQKNISKAFLKDSRKYLPYIAGLLKPNIMLMGFAFSKSGSNYTVGLLGSKTQSQVI